VKKDTCTICLPSDYFEGKDGTNYRFTILKDIAVTGDEPPITYNDSHKEYITGLYEKYKKVTLYVHFPWCVEHCSYCHYYRGPIIKRTELENLLRAEKKHAVMLNEWIDLFSRDVPSIYFGGGTPTVIPGDLLAESMGFFVENYRGKGDCEVCSESSVITLPQCKED
jgi:oxygen-independent coproporphyrinogen-3 oxidase